MCINQERTRGRRFGTLTSTAADIHRLRRISGFAVIRTATLRVSADVKARHCFLEERPRVGCESHAVLPVLADPSLDAGAAAIRLQMNSTAETRNGAVSASIYILYLAFIPAMSAKWPLLIPLKPAEASPDLRCQPRPFWGGDI
jgi:hypothetical protein